MVENKETPSSLCRIGDEHYCIECCSGSRGGCPNLGVLPDGSRGCLGYGLESVREVDTPNGKEIIFPITPFCKKFDCLPLEIQSNDESKKKLIDIIKQLPPGEFKMSVVLESYYNDLDNKTNETKVK